MAIRPIYGCAGLSVGFVLLSTVLFLGTVGRGSTFAFWSLFPGIWLTSTIAGPIIATSDSGPTNLVAITLYSSLPNIVIYTSIFRAILKIAAPLGNSDPKK